MNNTSFFNDSLYATLKLKKKKLKNEPLYFEEQQKPQTEADEDRLGCQCCV